jgi:hypothetical protein
LCREFLPRTTWLPGPLYNAAALAFKNAGEGVRLVLSQGIENPK